MNKYLMVLAALCLTMAANAAVTTHLTLDSRTGVRECPSEGVGLRFDASWYEKGETVRITDNGTVVANGTAGYCIWRPTDDSSAPHLLQMDVLRAGEVIATETAQFSLGYIRNVTARQLWPHKKVEVCYTLADDIGEVVEDGDVLLISAVSSSQAIVAKARTIIGDTRNTPGLHRVVWDMEADGVQLTNGSSIEVGFGNRLIHRWSFNGDLTDSVGGQTATIVGNVTTDGDKYITNSGASGSSYIDLGDWILPTNGLPVTIEMWASCLTAQSYQRIFEFGSMPNGSSYSVYDTSKYSRDSIAINRGGDFYCFNGAHSERTIACLDAFSVGREYHIAAVIEPLDNGRWKISFYQQDAVTGETLSQASVVMDQDWSIQSIKQTEMLLGQPLTTWDECFNNGYNELRVWNRALSEAELSENTLAGADAKIPKVCSVSAEIIVPSEAGPSYSVGYSPIDACNVALEINGREVLSSTEAGTYEWTPELPGTYVLAHFAGTNVFTRKVVHAGADDAKVLGIWWLDRPVSNLFPNIYASVTNVLIAPTVTRLPEGAFAGCAGLGLDQRTGLVVLEGCLVCVNGDCPAHVEIPEGVRLIADGVFRGCSGLESVTFPSTLKHIGANAFWGCTNLECVELPEGLESVGEGAFRDCTWVQEVVFPASLRDIGAFAFANCTMLEGVECVDGLVSVGDCAFSNCWRMLSVSLPATVDEIGSDAFYNCKNLLGVTVPAHVDALERLFPDVCQTIQAVAVAEGELELVSGFFSGCVSVEEVELPDTIREISESTFEGCSELRRAVLPSELEKIGNRAFYGCGMLSAIDFPKGVASIGDQAFYGCDTLSSLAFSEELVSIGKSAFAGCGHVNEMTFSEKLREIGDDAFNGLPRIANLKCPASVRTIGARAFKGVWDDAEIKLPAGLESIGADAFANCSSIRQISLPAVTTPIKSAFPSAYAQINSVKILGAPEVIPTDFCRDVVQLTGIQIPSSVTNIGNYAFYGLSNLAEIGWPSGLQTIGQYAFSGDRRLVALALPQSVESIGSYAFNGCSGVVTVTLPQTVESVGYRAFYGCSNVRIVSCSGELGTFSSLFPSAYGQITTVSVSAGTTQLKDDLFSGCSNLSEIDLPQGITKIGARTFKYCTALTSFGVPGGVVSLGGEAFYGCTGLTALSLPEGLTSIPSDAFRNCRALTEIVIPSTVNYLASDVFNGCTALVSVSYLGSCPQFDSGCYSGTPSDLVTHVVKGSTGWDGIASSKALPEYWPTANARTITYWTPNTFEATFDGNGGTPSSSVVVQTTGMTYALPEDEPELLGAQFGGWWTQPVNGGRIRTTTKVTVVGAQTFYAHWKYNGYAVRFDANGGLGEMPDQALTVNAAAELAANRYVRKDCRFAGWSLVPDGERAFEDGETVENLSFEQDAVVTLYAVWCEKAWDAADYLNIPGRSFVNAGDAGWFADDDDSHDGIGSMRSGVLAAADEGARTRSVLRTTVIGTGAGSFWWKVDCEPNDGADYYDYCEFRIDGNVVAQIAGTTDWEEVEYEIAGAGEHVLEWEFTRDDWDDDESLYENAAWVDEFVWTPTPVTLSFDANGADGEPPAAITKHAGCEVALPQASSLRKAGMVFNGWTDGENVWQPGSVYAFGSSDAVLRAVWEEKVWTLEEAAGLVGVTLTTGGDAVWTVDLTTNCDGEASIRSGVIGDSQTTWVSLNVSGPGTISFRTLVSGEYARGKMCDYLKLEIDGAGAFSSYDANWSNVVVEVSGKGSHTLTWTYLKNASKAAGDDCAWLDDLVWTPSAAPDDPIPDLGDTPTAAEVEKAVADAKDTKIQEYIDETNYNDFRDWAGTVKTKDGADAGTHGVMGAQNAWLSYALGQGTLLETAPTDEDLTVETFTPAEESGKFDFTVAVDGVTIGDAATKENLKKVFGLEGAATLDAGAFSGANVEIEFEGAVDGKVRFTAGPTEKGAGTFFMRVKLAE